MAEVTNGLSVALLGSAFLGVVLVLYRLYQRGTGWVRVGTLQAINLFPLKSGAATAVPKARCHYIGPFYKNTADRMFVVYDEEGNVVTGRTSPKLLKIQVLPTDLQTVFRFKSSCGSEFLEVDVTKTSPLTSIIRMKFPTTDTEILETQDCGENAAAWISSELERPGVRLGFWPPGFNRDIFKPRYREVGVFDISNDIAGAYSNLSSYLLLNRSSVDDLVRRLGPDSSVGTENFRGNIIISGAPPYAEDRWKKLKIGTASFKIVKPCVRCILVTIDPKTLEKDPNLEPLRTLKTYRQLTNPKERNIEGDSPVMGCYMGLIGDGEISVGDPVYALPANSKERIFRTFPYF